MAAVWLKAGLADRYPLSPLGSTQPTPAPHQYHDGRRQNRRFGTPDNDSCRTYETCQRCHDTARAAGEATRRRLTLRQQKRVTFRASCGPHKRAPTAALQRA
jgi:hypothetical protein